MLSALFTGLISLVSITQAINEPSCFRIGRTIIAKNLQGCGCAHIEGQYDTAYEIEDGKLIVRDLEQGGVINLEVYGGAPMILPGDECCIPTEWKFNLVCVNVYPDKMGECYRDLESGEVVITGLPQTPDFFHTNMISCVHDIVNYGMYAPDSEGSVTFQMTPADLLLNTEVELYATWMPECCGCYIMSLECPIKEQEPEGCQSCLTDNDCPSSPSFFGETANGDLPNPQGEEICGSYCNNGQCSNVPEAPEVCVGKNDWTCGQSLHKCGGGSGLSACYCDVTVEGDDFCWKNDQCSNSETCSSSTDCPSGKVCVTSCCGTSCLPICPDPQE